MTDIDEITDGRVARGQERRDEIARAVIDVVAEHGLRGLTHRKVADAAGVPLGSTTYHFETLDDLMVAGLELAAERNLGMMRRAAERLVPGADVAAWLTDLVVEMVTTWRESNIAERELYLEAIRSPALRPAATGWDDAFVDILEPHLGDREAAKHYAEKAAQLAPQLAWAGTAALELKTAAGDWDGAIRLLDNQKKAKQLERDTVKRKRAVLLTALAMDNLEKDPAKAKTAAQEAHRLAPDFAPAAVTAAQALFRQNDLRKGSHILESAWRKAPHPEVALAYVNARPGDSSHDRFKRAKRLEQLKPNNIESSMIVAQMALEAGEYSAARKAIAAVLRNEPREGAFMLMADIEDAETGDQGKVREWLARAVRAPRDPAWTADGYVSEHWAPISPITGRLDAFEWKVPVERLGPVLENDLDPMVPGIPASSAKAPAETVPAKPAPEPEPEDAEEMEIVSGEIESGPVIEGEAVKDEPEEKPSGEKAAETEAESGKPAEKRPEEKKPAKAKAETRADDVTVMPSETAKETPPVKKKDVPAEEPKEQEELRRPLPDDPGVDPNSPPEEPSGRFRLF